MTQPYSQISHLKILCSDIQFFFLKQKFPDSTEFEVKTNGIN